MLVIDPNIHALPWTPNNTSADIDNNLATIVNCDNQPDAMTMILSSVKADSGALCSINRPVPIVNGRPLKFHKASWQIKPSQLAKKWNRIYETDAILVWPPAPTSAAIADQWYNGSVQANQSTKPPCYQIDRVVNTDATGKIKYGWQSTSISGGATYEPDAWNFAEVVYAFDYDNKTTSVLSINKSLIVPALQNVLANWNNWSLPVPNQGVQPLVKYQAQAHTMAANSGFEIQYTLTAYWSDNPQFQ